MFWLLVFVAVVAALIGSMSCSKKSKMSDTLRVAIPVSPVTLDTRIATDSYGIMISRLINDGLFMTNEEMEVVPLLVDKYEQPSDTTYVFHIRRDVKFHDGTPLTAEDVAYTYNSIKDGTVKSAFRGGWFR